MIVLALNPYHRRCLFQVYVCMYIHILALAIFDRPSSANLPECIQYKTPSMDNKIIENAFLSLK